MASEISNTCQNTRKVVKWLRKNNMEVKNIFSVLGGLAVASSKQLGGKHVVICLGTENDAFIVSSHPRISGLTPERKNVFCGLQSALASEFLLP